MGEQEGNIYRYPGAPISYLTFIPRLEGTQRNLHLLPRLLGRRPRPPPDRQCLLHLQETSPPLHRDPHQLSTFHRLHARHCRRSGRTLYLMNRIPCRLHPRAMTLGAFSRRFLQVGPALKHQRKMFAVDMLTSSSNQPRHHLHHLRRLHPFNRILYS